MLKIKKKNFIFLLRLKKKKKKTFHSFPSGLVWTSLQKSSQLPRERNKKWNEFHGKVKLNHAEVKQKKTYHI